MRGILSILTITAITAMISQPEPSAAAGSGTGTRARTALGKDKERPLDGRGPALAGINFPPQRGNTRTGSFCGGVYNWRYTNKQIADANATFNAMRLPINIETANDREELMKMRHYVDQFAGKHAIIALVDTTSVHYRDCNDDKTDQGDGIPNRGAAAAWAKIHAVFKGYPNVHYEIFNEPHGFGDAGHYVREMKAIIHDAKLPPHRCILDGTGYADNIQAVAAAGWTGDLGYHFYPGSIRTQPDYSNLVQTKIGALGKRTWITEFGANLGYNNPCYDRFDKGDHKDESSNINALRGLDDALRALRARGQGVKGVFFWHGRHNDDSYDFWSSKNTQGACKVREIERHD
jgi:hypothetical protein